MHVKRNLFLMVVCLSSCSQHLYFINEYCIFLLIINGRICLVLSKVRWHSPFYEKERCFVGVFVNRFLCTILIIIILLGVVGQSNAQEVLFMSASDSRLFLSSKDTFLTRMSPFDRAARIKTDHEVSESQFIEFTASSALDWEKHEKSLVETAFKKIQTAIAHLSLPLPEKIFVIKTSGKEEGGAAYTRENAVILPRGILASSEMEIQKILAHELFHISSRTYPKLARLLYKTIGFHYCGEIEFPADLALRKITNPDAPKNDYYIQLKLGAEKVFAVPVLFSRTARYDITLGGEFFKYLQLAFLLIEQPVDTNTPRVLYDASAPRLVRLQEVTGFFEQVGQNTDYIIHPEEILADNFALLVLGEEDVRSPEVLTRMKSVLAKHSLVGRADSIKEADPAVLILSPENR